MQRLRSRTAPGLAALATFALASGCGGSEPIQSTAAGVAAAGAGTAVDPRVADIRRALAAGLPDAAWTLLDSVGDSLGAEGDLLRARAALLEGDGVGALREIEAAKQESERPDPRVLATEVEILASLDRLDAAREALRDAYAEVGRGAELERARGWVLLRTPGGAREGLTALETARELDPDLPFLEHPLLQAHLLVGREALTNEAADQALAHALLARQLAPDDPDARELEADARAALLDFDGAIPLYEELREEGRGSDDAIATLQQRRGTFLLLKGRRDEAIEAYRAARELGLDDEGLGFGADLLAEEAVKRVDAASEAFAAGDLEAAETGFSSALELDPANLEARDHLAVCRFKLGDFEGAAMGWRRVLESARERGIELPDPVHLNLARAWHAAGTPERAREVLEEYLASEPDGPWAEATREMLDRLAEE
ncbi:MAG TPA: tetratricopeptide repeat protein [Planctomycetes bacterium]|nr:tetratricopeptide repeat protein [Planctomycetota bacterium]